MMPPNDNDQDKDKIKNQDDIHALDERIDKMKAKHGLSDKDKKAKATNEGVKAGVELCAPIAVCFFIGVSLDNWLETSPIFMMLFFVLGVITGFWNIYKLTK
jgi:ATP synthase protein I